MVWRRSGISGAKVHTEFGPLTIVRPLACGTRCNAGTAGREVIIFHLCDSQFQAWFLNAFGRWSITAFLMALPYTGSIFKEVDALV